MARHRDIRNTKSYDYDYDYDDVYGQSYEDDYGVSPGTMAQFTYSRSRPNDFSSFMPTESTVQEADEDEAFMMENVDEGKDFSSSRTPPSKKNPPSNNILLQSCLEMMHDVVGDSYSDEALKDAALNSNYNVERALNILMSSPKADSMAPKSDLFMISQPPKEQRQRRNRRAEATTKESGSQKSFQNSPTVKKVITTATPRKTGFDTSQSNRVVVTESPVANGFSNQNPREPGGSVASIKKLTLDNPKTLVLKTPILAEKTENASLTPNVKSKSAPVPDYQNSKIAIEMKQRYEARSKESKAQISMVVIGHVDAGKSTLMGHLLFLAGEVSKRAMHRYEQESKKLGKASFAYAWVLDETGEERSRGVTMDVGLTKFETEHRFVTLMDAPGHKDFIPNMITGASQADVAVLVVNATTGEFEAGFDLGGQTREHSLLVRSLGISQLAVAVNKLDTVQWSQKRFNEIVSKLSLFLKQAGFKDTDVFYVPVSGLMGENLAKKASDPALVSWYKGPSLIDVIDKFKPPQRPVDYPLRFCVTDVVRGQGTGINVSGKIETGGVKIGSKVIVLPASENSLVKSIERHDGMRVEFALAGDHVTLTCHGIDIMKIQSGSVLSDIQNQIPVVTEFKARVIIFNIGVPVTRGFPVELHYKAASEPAILKRLLSVLHKSTGEVVTKKPKVILKGQNVMVQIMTHRTICIEEYHKVKEMGRFTLRYAGSTIAAGVVTEIIK